MPSPTVTAHDQLSSGDRIEAVWFTLDTGLRLWPEDPYHECDHDCPSADTWRLVEVHGTGPGEFTELERGNQRDLFTRYPDARYGINDNETVPTGTAGTVESSGYGQVGVRWDNGSVLSLGPHDQVRALTA